MNDHDDENLSLHLYKVGYGRPPIPTRFEKGRSGNPMGRPKASPAAKQKLSAEARSTILQLADRQLPTSDGEKSAFEIQLKAEQALGVKGDSRALKHSLDRTILAKAEEAVAIEDDHAYWHRFREIAEAMINGGEPLPDKVPHPEDLVFEAGKFVQIIGGDPKIAARNRAFAIAFRDIMILKDGLDRRNLSPDQNVRPTQSLVIADIFNSALPPRLKLDDVVLTLRIDRGSRIKKRDLERKIRVACDLIDMPDVTKIPSATISLAAVRAFAARRFHFA